MYKFIPSLIIIESAAQAYPLTEQIKRFFNSVPTHVVRKLKSFSNQPVAEQKGYLVLSIKKGELVKEIKRCGSQEEFNIIHAINWPMDCNYC